ncbi:hypothetical protein TNCV_1315511 [Trichonephila clavipes]|uniref:Uncharacterized protein n=1 Tax=Trichonephila clavipes TaxID=2585209 RepID=A0A8X6VDL3_TRICX|nr:hypothetical protein TNCV_1315511 [Trichonephila clavipes]
MQRDFLRADYIRSHLEFELINLEWRRMMVWDKPGWHTMQKTGFQVLNEDEIASSVQEESDPVNDKTYEDEDINNNESSKGPTNADEFSSL